MGVVIKKYKVIIQQDDCAPDSKKYFDEQFFEKFGTTVEKYTAVFVPVDLEDTEVYLIGKHKISNEIGFWKVEELVE